jgi:hypothetical protein
MVVFITQFVTMLEFLTGWCDAGVTKAVRFVVSKKVQAATHLIFAAA